MTIALGHLAEARRITHNKGLTVQYLPAQGTYRFGFMTAKTGINLHTFEDEDGVAHHSLEQDDGITWNVITLLRGSVLCTWTDPFGRPHYRLLAVGTPKYPGRISAQSKSEEQLWRLMAETGVPFDLLRQVVASCGVKNVRQAIELASLEGKLSVRLGALESYAENGEFETIRHVLADTPFAAFDDQKLLVVLNGANRYAATQKR